MDVGIGLPATIPGVEREQILDWARRAESRGFSTLGTVDRTVYPNYEPLMALTAAAAVTERIRLTTAILILPLRANTAEVAKQALTLDAFSNGRLDLGVAVGARPDDYEAGGVDLHTRGKRMDEQLDEMRRIWGGEEKGFAGAIGPQAHDGGPTLLLGGLADPAYRRTVQKGDGWIGTGMAPDDYAKAAERLRGMWRDEGREGEPQLKMLLYFSLGDRAEANADWYIHDYYGFLGDIADQIRASVATDADTVRRYVQGYADAGCGEAIFFPSSADPDQVDLLADAAGL